MSFKDRSFSQRIKQGGMGDMAEAVFENVYPLAWDRYGWDRPSTPMQGMVAFIRYTPDYMTFHGPVEVQGFGGDQTIKIKLDKLDALCDWDLKQETRLFLFDSKNSRHATITIANLVQMVRTKQVEVRSFPEGKEYYAIPASLVDGWTHYDPEDYPNA